MSDRKLGPNTRKLLAHFIAREAVLDGGGLASGLDFLTNPERRRTGIEKAMSDLEAALALVKTAPEWANWWAVDSNGEANWFGSCPDWSEVAGRWRSMYRTTRAGNIIEGHTTLRQRPQPQDAPPPAG